MKKSIDDLLAKKLDDAFLHLRNIREGRINTNKDKPPNNVIERMIGKQVAYETRHLDHAEIPRMNSNIHEYDYKIRILTDYREELIKARDKAVQGNFLIYGDVIKDDLNPKIDYLKDELEWLTDNRDRMKEMRDKTQAAYYREFNAAVKRAIKKVDENLTWAQRIPELKRGRQTDADHTYRLLRNDLIVDAYRNKLVKDSGLGGRGQKKRIILDMVEELKQAGKRLGYESIRKILAADGIK